jgi:hypothetical protein
MSDIETIEIQYLHRELLLRLWIQNLILILLMLVFPGAVFLAASLGHHEEVVALGYVGASGMGALYWIHNAARTVQIKTYLLEWEARYQGFMGWETWLKDNRMPGLLGARWIISTKAVFVGSQLAMILIAGMLTRQSGIDSLNFSLAATGMIVTLFFLRQPRMPRK